MNRKITPILVIISILSISSFARAQDLPTTLVVQSKEMKEHCYELTKIDKVTFGEASTLLFKHKQEGIQFNPQSFAFSDVEKIFFARDKQPNESPQIESYKSTLKCSYVEGHVHIEGLTKSDLKVMVYNTEGQLIQSTPITGSSLVLDTKAWARGVYILTTVANNTTKIILP